MSPVDNQRLRWQDSHGRGEADRRQKPVMMAGLASDSPQTSSASTPRETLCEPWQVLVDFA